MEKVTINDIAAAAGVSASTVSRIINGKGKYAEATKRAVQDAIRRLGYSPNLVAQSLRASRSNLVGIVTPSISDIYMAQLAEKLVRQVIREGFTPLLCVTLNDETIQEAFARTLSTYHTGAIIYLFSETPPLPEAEHIPSIYLGPAPEGVENSRRVMFDTVGGAKQAADELIRAGARSIAYLQTPRNRTGHMGRLLGYQQSLWENGLQLRDELVITLDLEHGLTVTQALSDLRVRGIPFDGIFANSTANAIEAIDYLRRCDIRVPEDVRVISMDDGPLAGMYSPSISTIGMDDQLACDATLTQLKKLLSDAPEDQQAVRLPMVLHPRETTGRKILSRGRVP